MMRSPFFCLVISLASCGIAAADFVISFESGGQFMPSEVAVDPGEELIINVLLTQTLGESRLSAISSGLVSANFQIPTSSDFATVRSYTLGPGLVERSDAPANANNSLVSSSLLRIDSQENSGTGISGISTANTAIDGGGNSVLLATLTVDISPSAIGSFVLTATPLTDGFGDRFTVVGDVFPDTLAVSDGSLTLRSTAIPEPSSVALLAIVGLGLTLRTRQRRATTRL